jgi:hypothetical protein
MDNDLFGSTLSNQIEKALNPKMLEFKRSTICLDVKEYFCFFILIISYISKFDFSKVFEFN